MSDDYRPRAKNFGGEHQALDRARFFKLLLAELLDSTSFNCRRNGEHIEFCDVNHREGGSDGKWSLTKFAFTLSTKT